jgi:hypothetical protein
VLPSATERPPTGERRFERRSFAFGVATAQDDDEVRRMLRETSFPGQVSLSFERESDSLAAGQIEGDVHDIIVARERITNRIVAIASRSSRQRFVNGSPARVGYLGQFRVAPGCGGRRDLFSDGFEFCRSLHRRDTASIYLSSVIADNTRARRLLELGLPGWPVFRPVDDLTTLAVPAGSGARRRVPNVDIVSGERLDISELASVLARNNSRYQFAPCWTAGDLMSPTRCRGLRPGDFLVAVRGGSIVGCAALWDQRAFKQVIVRGYSRTLSRWRQLINRVGPALGVPVLPSVGSQLGFAYLSHLAVDADDPDVLVSLVSAACRSAQVARLHYIAIGVSAAGPLGVPLRRAFAHRRYDSVLYVGCWPDGQLTADGLDGRPSHPEMAVL